MECINRIKLCDIGFVLSFRIGVNARIKGLSFDENGGPFLVMTVLNVE